MILTCPECASEYFVEADKVGPQGRTVRCAACAHTWRAFQTPPTTGALRSDPAASMSAAPALEPLSVDPEINEPPVRVRRIAPVSQVLRDEAADKRKAREAAATGAVWAAMGTGFVALILAAVLFRVDVVRLWPRTAGAYAFARMPVNPTGLELEQVRGSPGLTAGRAVLTVAGLERNVSNAARLARPLRVVLYDKAGKRLINRVAEPIPGPIAPGAARGFALNLLDPPQDAASFVVEFAFDVATRDGAPSPAPAMRLRRIPLAPAPPADAVAPLAAKEATALPSTSPYALPAAANAGSR